MLPLLDLASPLKITNHIELELCINAILPQSSDFIHSQLLQQSNILFSRYQVEEGFGQHQLGADLQAFYNKVRGYTSIIEHVLNQYHPTRKLAGFLGTVEQTIARLFYFLKDYLKGRKNYLEIKLRELQEKLVIQVPGHCNRCKKFILSMDVEETKVLLGAGQFSDPFNLYEVGTSDLINNRNIKEDTEYKLKYAEVWENKMKIQEKFHVMMMENDKREYGLAFSIGETQKMENILKEAIEQCLANQEAPQDQTNFVGQNARLLAKSIYLKVKQLKGKDLIGQQMQTIEEQQFKIEDFKKELQKTGKKNKQLKNKLLQKQKQIADIQSKQKRVQQQSIKSAVQMGSNDLMVKNLLAQHVEDDKKYEVLLSQKKEAFQKIRDLQRQIVYLKSQIQNLTDIIQDDNSVQKNKTAIISTKSGKSIKSIFSRNKIDQNEEKIKIKNSANFKYKKFNEHSLIDESKKSQKIRKSISQKSSSLAYKQEKSIIEQDEPQIRAKKNSQTKQDMNNSKDIVRQTNKRSSQISINLDQQQKGEYKQSRKSTKRSKKLLRSLRKIQKRSTVYKKNEQGNSNRISNQNSKTTSFNQEKLKKIKNQQRKSFYKNRNFTKLQSTYQQNSSYLNKNSANHKKSSSFDSFEPRESRIIAQKHKNQSKPKNRNSAFNLKAKGSQNNLIPSYPSETINKMSHKISSRTKIHEKQSTNISLNTSMTSKIVTNKLLNNNPKDHEQNKQIIQNTLPLITQNKFEALKQQEKIDIFNSACQLFNLFYQQFINKKENLKENDSKEQTLNMQIFSNWMKNNVFPQTSNSVQQQKQIGSIKSHKRQKSHDFYSTFLSTRNSSWKNLNKQNSAILIKKLANSSIYSNNSSFIESFAKMQNTTNSDQKYKLAELTPNNCQQKQKRNKKQKLKEQIFKKTKRNLSQLLFFGTDFALKLENTKFFESQNPLLIQNKNLNTNKQVISTKNQLLSKIEMNYMNIVMVLLMKIHDCNLNLYIAIKKVLTNSNCTQFDFEKNIKNPKDGEEHQSKYKSSHVRMIRQSLIKIIIFHRKCRKSQKIDNKQIKNARNSCKPVFHELKLQNNAVNGQLTTVLSEHNSSRVHISKSFIQIQQLCVHLQKFKQFLEQSVISSKQKNQSNATIQIKKQNLQVIQQQLPKNFI